MIILLYENFISYYKSSSETVMYLIELLHNFNIPSNDKNIHLLISSHSLLSKCQADSSKCGTPGPGDLKHTWHFSAPCTKKVNHAFEGLVPGPDAQEELTSRPILSRKPVFSFALRYTFVYAYSVSSPPGGVICFRRIVLNVISPNYPLKT